MSDTGDTNAGAEQLSIPPPPPAGATVQGGYQPHWGWPYGVQYPPQAYYTPGYPYGFPRDHPRAGLALGLGIGGLLGGFITLGLAFGIGPFAWYIGQRARDEIRRNKGVYHNEGNATAGMVLGIIATVFLAFALVLWTIVIVVAINDSATLSDGTSA